MSNLISLLLPTRGRPDAASRFLNSVYNTTNNLNSVEVVICVDDDDPESFDIDHPYINTKKLIVPRTTMGQYNSLCFEKSSGDIIALVNDDMLIRTKDWDDKVKSLHASIEDQIYLAYGNDLFKKSELCTFPIMSRRTCEVLVEPYHKAYHGAFIDYHLMDIFMRLSNIGIERTFYLNDVIFEHLHYRTGKMEYDLTYAERDRFGDDSNFINLSTTRVACFNNLKSFIESGTPPKALPTYSKTTKSPINTIILLYRNIFKDKSLPLRWRTKICAWFLMRTIYKATSKQSRKT